MNEWELMCFHHSAGFVCEPCVMVGFLITNGQSGLYMELFMLAEDDDEINEEFVELLHFWDDLWHSFCTFIPSTALH